VLDFCVGVELSLCIVKIQIVRQAIVSNRRKEVEMEPYAVKGAICIAYGVGLMMWCYRGRTEELNKDSSPAFMGTIVTAAAVWMFWEFVVTASVIILVLWIVWRKRDDLENLFSGVRNNPRGPRLPTVVEQDWLELEYGDDGRGRRPRAGIRASVSRDSDRADREREEQIIDVDFYTDRPEGKRWAPDRRGQSDGE
jgi:hypothetical protein